MATAAWFSDIPGSMGLGSNPWSGSDGVPLRGSQLGVAQRGGQLAERRLWRCCSNPIAPMDIKDATPYCLGANFGLVVSPFVHSLNINHALAGWGLILCRLRLAANQLQHRDSQIDHQAKIEVNHGPRRCTLPRTIPAGRPGWRSGSRRLLDSCGLGSAKSLCGVAMVS